MSNLLQTSATTHRLFISLFLAAVVPAHLSPQGYIRETRPYFSLSSDKTFGLDETPSISMSGFGVSAVQIRVYRVRDVTEFFRKLESSHSFGQYRDEEPVAKRNLLGDLRAWKHNLRREIRLFIRDQFTESVSAHLKHVQTAPKGQEHTKEDYYASTPILNRDQMVLSFLQSFGARQNWDTLTVPIRVRDKGVYLVEAATGGLRAYTIVVKSNLVSVTKIGKQRVVSYVANRKTGEPVPGATVSTMVRNGLPANFETNADGLAEIKIAATESAKSEDIRVVVRMGDDVTINSLPLWNYGEFHTQWNGYIYTDRPVYRPGDTVHFRAIIRASKSPVGYTIPSDQSFAVQVQDPDGKSIYAKHLTANSVGVIHDEFIPDRTASLGGYYIQVAASDGTNTTAVGNFEIQEYKKPEYEVRVTAEKPRVLEGEKLRFTVHAQYYFGEPVKGAKVEYSVYRSRYYYPFWRNTEEGDDTNDVTDDQSGDYDGSDNEEVLKATAQLDQDGTFQAVFPTTVSDHQRDYRYRVEARVTDEGRREISGTGWGIATYGTFIVNVQPKTYFYQPKGTAEFEVKAVDYDGKPVQTRATLQLERLVRGQTPEYRTVSTTSVIIGADGTGTGAVTLPDQGGSFLVTLAADSVAGRVVEGSTYLWVASDNWDGIYESTNRTLQLVPDKHKYAAGDTAHILIVTGKPNTPVLVAIEGHDVRLTKLLRSKGATTSFDYKVRVDDEPGLFVSAQFIRNGELFQNTKHLVVPPNHHKLDVQIATDKLQYLPGETATYQVKVTTPDGRGVPKADLSLGVVDEAIYAIRPDTTPDLLKFYYGNESNGVNTLNSLSYYFNGEAGDRRMLLASSTVKHRPLAQLKREQLVQPKIRKIFPDTSFWAADLTTDSSGTAQAKVAFPDSLTTWRSTVKAVTATDRFGGAVSKTIVRKNVIMRLAIPRFFVEGDKTVISGIVQNYLTTAKHARVTATLTGFDLIAGQLVQEIDVPSHGTTRVDWRVKTKSGVEAKITGQAQTDTESDALELTVPIRPQGVSILQSNGGSAGAPGTVNQQVTFASDAESGSRSVSIRLSSSVAGTLFNALDFLTSFPYGCTEQTMSSFLPDLMVTKAMHDLGGVPPIDQVTLDQQVAAGLGRLYDMQHEDGGWGWWPSDASHPFMTAYVVAGLAQAKAEGVTINEASLGRGITWLKTEVARGKDTGRDLSAYDAYSLALAGSPDSALAGRLFGNRTSLSPYGKALLGLALESAKDRRAATLAEDLEATATQSGDEAWWIADRDDMLDFDTDASPEATAYVVKLLSHQRKNSPLLPKAALWLVNHRNEGYWWSSTKQTAMVIYGLLDYVKQTGELDPDFTATISVNGSVVGKQQFTKRSAVTAPELFLDETKLQPGTNQVSITTAGKGRLYYAITGTHYSNSAKNEERGAISLNILRDYFRLVPIKEGDQTVYDLSPLSGPVASGDIIAARLTVTGSDWKYLLTEDPIPAGTEFIERDNLYKLRSRPPWWQYYFSRRELHDDRMAIFQTHFSRGQQEYFYLLKVVNPGIFHTSPARVQPMYKPGISATTESKLIEVRQ